jgi:hypothetical protein
MTTKHISLFATLFALFLSAASFANPLHDFVYINDSEGISDYIREEMPSLKEFTEVDQNGYTPIALAKKMNYAGLFEFLKRTEGFLRTAEQFRGFGVMHPIHAYIERGDTWGFTLYLMYFEVTLGEIMHDRNGRSIIDIARETKNGDMIDLVNQTLFRSNESSTFSPLKEVKANRNTYASNSEAVRGNYGKEEDDAEPATLMYGTDDENLSPQHLGSDGLFFEFE